MNNNLISDSSPKSRIHPLVAGAAVSVILACATGVAAMTGLLPVSHAVTEPPAQAVTPAAQVASAPVVAQRPEQRPAVEPAPSEPRVQHHRAAAAPSPRYADNDRYQDAPRRAEPRQVALDPDAGEVVAVNALQTPEPTTGLGAVGGAVAGGLLGNQIGNGRGRVLATIAGAVGGGFAGNGIEHAVRKATTYQVQVRMHDGSYRNFTYQTQPDVQVGERVHVSGDSLVAS